MYFGSKTQCYQTHYPNCDEKILHHTKYCSSRQKGYKLGHRVIKEGC